MKTIITPEQLVLSNLPLLKASMLEHVAERSNWILDARGVLQADASGIQLILAVMNHHKEARVFIQPGGSLWGWFERLGVTASVQFLDDGSLVSSWSYNL